MSDSLVESRPCARYECDFHSEHPPCNRGWLDVDHVCPCWNARRRAEIHHTDPDDVVTVGTPMPASVRAAFRAALEARRPVPVPEVPEATPRVPAPRPTESGAEQEPLDERAVPVLQQLGVDTNQATPSLNRLATAVVTALDAGWEPSALAKHLGRNRGPDAQSPTRFWIWTLRPDRLGPACVLTGQLTLQATPSGPPR